MYLKLSENAGLGQVALCGNCDDVHVSVGAAAFRLPKEMFKELTRLFQEAAEHPLLNGDEQARFTVRFENGLPRFGAARKKGDFHERGL